MPVFQLSLVVQLFVSEVVAVQMSPLRRMMFLQTSPIALHFVFVEAQHQRMICATIESSEPNDEALRRQRKASGPSKPRKRVSTSKNKGKDKAHESDPEPSKIFVDLFARANISTPKSLVGGVQFYGSSHRSLTWSREIPDRYIHGLATMSDVTHVIITINPELARPKLEAIWIMVDTMFTVYYSANNAIRLGQPDQLHKMSTPRSNFILTLLRAKQLDCETAQVIKAMMTPGVLENPNYSLQAWFKN
ncbi:hypothetical protein B0H17DRAFT_1146021 [Mycena rosella]|uniref:Uncharacterized protein n=1 Tax=Mycena rosella TaxID=1033263 RepID=A0AAD7CPR1_MYCRO|nr:hypothetical protein B0H17DRAFT_1146021 [Mycena rosella]